MDFLASDSHVSIMFLRKGQEWHNVLAEKTRLFWLMTIVFSWRMDEHSRSFLFQSRLSLLLSSNII